MPKKYILFLSTNSIWGGSEVLWTQSAQRLSDKGYLVKTGLRYDYELVKQYVSLSKNYIDLRNRILPLSKVQRISQKLGSRKF